MLSSSPGTVMTLVRSVRCTVKFHCVPGAFGITSLAILMLAFLVINTQSEGSEFGCSVGVGEHTSNRFAIVIPPPISAMSMEQAALVSLLNCDACWERIIKCQIHCAHRVGDRTNESRRLHSGSSAVHPLQEYKRGLAASCWRSFSHVTHRAYNL